MPEKKVEQNDQHIYHHFDNDGARIGVKVEKNSRGFNYEATVTGSKTVQDALDLLFKAQTELEKRYAQLAEGDK